MNRKVINGLLLLAAATAGCGTFTSCKDTDEDYRTELKEGQYNLQRAIDELKDRVAAIKSCTCDLEGAIAKLKAELQKEIDMVKDDITKLDGRVESIETKIKQIDDLQAALYALTDRMNKAETAIETAQDTAKKAQASADKAQASADEAKKAADNALALIAEQSVAIETLKNELSGRLDQVESDVEGLTENMEDVKGRLDALDALDIDNHLNKAQQDATAALANAEANSKKITLLEQSVDALQSQIPQITGRIDTIDEEIRSLNNTVVGVLDRVEALEGDVANNAAYIENIYEILDKHAQDFEQLQNRVEKLYDILNTRLNKFVTDLNVNGTYNHVFGTFAAPFGIRSNMLIGYYGEADDSFEFPSASTAHNYDGPNNPVITSMDVMRLREAGLKPTQFNGGEVYMSNDGHNLGKLYSTVNPVNRNFKGLSPMLIKSNNEMAPIDDMHLQPGTDDDVLDFGATRAKSESGNGFYVSNINVSPENARKLRISAEAGLKGALKDVLVDRSKKDVAKLAKLVFEQVNGLCPAYAMKVEWDDPDGVDKDGNPTTTKNAVVSQYDLAVATIQPLGYSFAVDFSTDRRLKEITPLTEIINKIFEKTKGQIEIDLGVTGVENKIVIDWSSITGDNGFKIENGKLIIPAMPVYDCLHDHAIGVTQELELTYDPTLDEPLGNGQGALNEFVQSIVDAVNGYIGNPDDDKSLVGIINSQVTAQVNEMIDDINGQLGGLNANVESNIDKILDNINAEINGHLGRVDRVIDKINTLIGKLNNVIANPNNYLQVMMAYRAADGAFHHLSTSLADPTRLTKGGANGLELFATSYTAELIAPSYQKVVGVTNVYKNGVEAENASALAKKINMAKGSLAKVVTGSNQRFAVNTDYMEIGYTYEFLYTSVDYRGYVSSRKYYIQVQ